MDSLPKTNLNTSSLSRSAYLNLYNITHKIKCFTSGISRPENYVVRLPSSLPANIPFVNRISNTPMTIFSFFYVFSIVFWRNLPLCSALVASASSRRNRFISAERWPFSGFGLLFGHRHAKASLFMRDDSRRQKKQHHC